MGPTEDAREAAARARWESLYRRFHRPLVAYVERLTDDPDSAEDIAHESFVAAIVQFKAGAGRPSWPWLRGLATRLATTTTEDSFAVPAGLPVLGAGTPEPGTEDEPAGEVAAAFAALPPRDRLVLMLRFQEGWTQAEIGRLLKIEPGTVQALIGRAKRRLQLELRSLRGGDFGVVGWLSAARLRAYDALARIPAPSGDDVALGWRTLLERLQPLVGVLATSAATLSLVAVLGAQAGRGPTEVTDERRLVSLPVAAPDHRADGAPAESSAEATGGPPPADVRLAPGVEASEVAEGAMYRVDPAPVPIGPTDTESPENSVSTSAPVSFECPRDEHRRLSQAAGCPVLEVAARLFPSP